MSDHGGDDEWDADIWFAEIGLTKAAGTKIKANAIEDRKTLLLIRETDVDGLKLTLGDSLRLRAGIASLRSPTMPALEETDGLKVKTESKPVDLDVPKYTQRQVQELLAGRAAVDAGRGAAVDPPKVKESSALSSILGDSGDATVKCIRELMRELLNVDADASATNSKGEKAL